MRFQSKDSAFSAARGEANLEDEPWIVYEERREKEGNLYHVLADDHPMPEDWSMAWRVVPDDPL
jgi:hypothetical protein